MRLLVHGMLCLSISSLAFAADVQASTQPGGNTHSARQEPANPAKKRVTIHLESYADAKSAAAAQEFAAMLEDRLAKRSTQPSKQSEAGVPSKRLK